jgi:transcriptional regulator with XRE-family HTH domain
MARTHKRSPWNTKLMDLDRLARGWNYSEFAVEAGVSVQTVSRFLAGEFQSPKAARKLAEALGHTPERYLRRVAA